MKFDGRQAKVFTLSNGGAAVIDANNKLVAYKRKIDKDLRNWDYVRADFVGKRA